MKNFNIKAAIFEEGAIGLGIGKNDVLYDSASTFVEKIRNIGIKTVLISSNTNETKSLARKFDAVIIKNEEEKFFEKFSECIQAADIPAFHCVVFSKSETEIESAKQLGMRSCSVGGCDIDVADEHIESYDEIDIYNFLETGQKDFFNTTTWTIDEKPLKKSRINHTESIFALGNGYMGLRGVYEEQDEATSNEVAGMYLNEVYEKEVIPHIWVLKGYATHDQFTVNLQDWRFMSVYIDGEKVCFSNGNMLEHRRFIDMKNGCLKRNFVWESSSGKQIAVETVRIVNMKRFHGAEISYKITPINFNGEIDISSEVRYVNPINNKIATKIVQVGKMDGVDYSEIKTITTDISVSLAVVNDICASSYSLRETRLENGFEQLFTVNAKQGEEITLNKYAAFYSSNDMVTDICKFAVNYAKELKNVGFEVLYDEQSEYWKEHWNNGNIVIEGNERDDIAVRFNLFHLRQQIPPCKDMSVGATGLTGPIYSGKVFWDTEIYIAPYMNYVNPQTIKGMLMYRYKLLDKARERAIQMDGKGAMYSWCSINGEETSIVYEASTAEYHLGSDIAYAINRYYRTTGDTEFMYAYGAEMLFDTAVFLYDRGVFTEDTGNKFCLNVVCGPDEYACGVNNNFYTNMMLKFHFEFACEIYDKMKNEASEQLKQIEKKINISAEDVNGWRMAAENMYFRFNERLGIHEQDDSFVRNDPVDMSKIPKNFDIRGMYHPLNLWRIQVLKQADVVMLMFLLGDRYSIEEKRANYEYYEPKTNHGSSLSPAIHSIEANEIEKDEDAYSYFRTAAYMDLCDFKHNAGGGLHMACLGGTWMTVVNGYMGMRDYDNALILNPKIPEKWSKYKLRLLYRGSLIKIAVDKEKTVFTLESGNAVRFECYGKSYELKDELIVFATK